MKIQLANLGVVDYADFPFGLTLSNGDQVVMCEVAGPDRHNTITVVSQPTPVGPTNAVDFICKPFNRAKKYRITLYVLPGTGVTQCSEITPSSPASVNFIRTRSDLILTREEVDYVLETLYRPLPFGKQFVRFIRARRRGRSGK